MTKVKLPATVQTYLGDQVWVSKISFPRNVCLVVPELDNMLNSYWISLHKLRTPSAKVYMAMKEYEAYQRKQNTNMLKEQLKIVQEAITDGDSEQQVRVPARRSSNGNVRTSTPSARARTSSAATTTGASTGSAC